MNIFHNFKGVFLKISLVILGGIIGIGIWKGFPSDIDIYKQHTGTGIVSASDVFDSKKVKEAYRFIEQNYYWFHSKNQKTVEDAFLASLANSLGDKHSNYMNEDDSRKFVSTLQWDFEGIGAVIRENIKWIQIMKVLPGSPAEKNKLSQGDIITFVDGKSMHGMSADEAVTLIRWPKGTMVKITILSKKEADKAIEVIIQRDTVNVPTVYSEILSGTTLGYLEVSMFWENTVDEFIKEFNQLTSSGATGIIIDARNNGWWFLDAAVDLCSLILPKNAVIVSTKGNNPIENMTLYTKDSSTENTRIPLVFLVNSMSASATEITAWALQEYHRALIIGEKTYGKWSVQTPFSLSDGSLLKLTTAKWYTPNGKSIDEKGIEPDVIISLTDDDYKNAYDRQLEGAKKLLQYQIEKSISLEELKKEADTILNE